MELGANVVDSAVHAIDVVAFLVVADAFVHRNHSRSGEDSQVNAVDVQIRDHGVVGTALVAPFRIRNDGVVVIDQLAADAHADPLLRGVAKLGVGQLEIEAIRVRRLQGRLLEPGASVLHLSDKTKPTGGFDLHQETPAIQ